MDCKGAYPQIWAPALRAAALVSPSRSAATGLWKEAVDVDVLRTEATGGEAALAKLSGRRGGVADEDNDEEDRGEEEEEEQVEGEELEDEEPDGSEALRRCLSAARSLHACWSSFPSSSLLPSSLPSLLAISRAAHSLDLESTSNHSNDDVRGELLARLALACNLVDDALPELAANVDHLREEMGVLVGGSSRRGGWGLCWKGAGFSKEEETVRGVMGEAARMQAAAKFRPQVAELSAWLAHARSSEDATSLSSVWVLQDRLLESLHALGLPPRLQNQLDTIVDIDDNGHDDGGGGDDVEERRRVALQRIEVLDNVVAAAVAGAKPLHLDEANVASCVALAEAMQQSASVMSAIESAVPPLHSKLLSLHSACTSGAHLLSLLILHLRYALTRQLHHHSLKTRLSLWASARVPSCASTICMLVFVGTGLIVIGAVLALVAVMARDDKRVRSPRDGLMIGVVGAAMVAGAAIAACALGRVSKRVHEIGQESERASSVVGRESEEIGLPGNKQADVSREAANGYVKHPTRVPLARLGWEGSEHAKEEENVGRVDVKPVVEHHHVRKGAALAADGQAETSPKDDAAGLQQGTAAAQVEASRHQQEEEERALPQAGGGQQSSAELLQPIHEEGEPAPTNKADEEEVEEKEEEEEAPIQLDVKLGLDPVRDPDLLWIAEQALRAPLPAAWEEFDDDHGRVYFHNTLTGVTTWAHPLEDHFRASGSGSGSGSDVEENGVGDALYETRTTDMTLSISQSVFSESESYVHQYSISPVVDVYGIESVSMGASMRNNAHNTSAQRLALKNATAKNNKKRGVALAEWLSGALSASASSAGCSIDFTDEAVARAAKELQLFSHHHHHHHHHHHNNKHNNHHLENGHVLPKPVVVSQPVLESPPALLDLSGAGTPRTVPDAIARLMTRLPETHGGRHRERAREAQGDISSALLQPASEAYYPYVVYPTGQPRNARNPTPPGALSTGDT
eukprot:jgi/Chlat1/2464/Chrsp171S02353